MPAGCHMELDRVATEIVLENIRGSLPSRWQAKVEELRAFARGESTVSLARFLSESELEAFKNYVEKILEEAPDGKTVEWKAPKTQFVSKITPHRTFTEEGRRCREATIDSSARDRHQRGRYLFCKVKTGAWEFALPEERPAARK